MKNNQFFKKHIEKVAETDVRFSGVSAQVAWILARLSLGKKVCAEDFEEILDSMYYRRDCSDFRVNMLLRSLYLYGNSPLMEEDCKNKLKEALLDYDYWFTENMIFPGKQILWTENHVMLYMTAEYLACRLYPEEVFRARGKKGKEIFLEIYPKILHWIKTKALTGFCEWDSNTYADENVHSLLNLYDFSGDPTLQSLSKRLVDIIILGMGINSYKGFYCSSHGRTYTRMVKKSNADSTALIQKILWDLGSEDITHASSLGGFAMGTSSYEVPDIINKIALDSDDVLEDKEQQSFNVEDGPSFGKGFTEEEDLAFYWQNMAYSHVDILEKNIEMEKKYNININEWPNRELHYVKKCRELGIEPEKCRCPNYLSRVNKMTYKTPHYMLSCAQDYRKGEKGFQQHVWQGTLDGNAIVFTNHPGTFGEQDGRPDMWVGNRYFPKAVQYKNLLVCIYNIEKDSFINYSHGFFPRDEFDEVIERKGWIFGQKNDGYVALYSQNGYRWSEHPKYHREEVICEARQNIWICQMGSKEEYSSFEAFVNHTAAYSMQFHGLNLDLCNTPYGRITVGWDTLLKVNESEILIRNYKRFDNKYCQSEYMSGVYDIRYGNEKLQIVFE